MRFFCLLICFSVNSFWVIQRQKRVFAWSTVGGRREKWAVATRVDSPQNELRLWCKMCVSRYTLAFSPLITIMQYCFARSLVLADDACFWFEIRDWRNCSPLGIELCQLHCATMLLWDVKIINWTVTRAEVLMRGEIRDSLLPKERLRITSDRATLMWAGICLDWEVFCP